MNGKVKSGLWALVLVWVGAIGGAVGGYALAKSQAQPERELTASFSPNGYASSDAIANAPSFNCARINEPQVVDERLVFLVSNDCSAPIGFASWDINIYKAGETQIFDTAMLMVSEVPPGSSKQDKAIADLPDGEFRWEALPSGIR